MQKIQVIEYVADMAEQLATLAKDHLPSVAKVLEIAADLARDALERWR